MERMDDRQLEQMVSNHLEKRERSFGGVPSNDLVGLPRLGNNNPNNKPKTAMPWMDEKRRKGVPHSTNMDPKGRRTNLLLSRDSKGGTTLEGGKLQGKNLPSRRISKHEVPQQDESSSENDSGTWRPVERRNYIFDLRPREELQRRMDQGRWAILEIRDNKNDTGTGRRSFHGGMEGGPNQNCEICGRHNSIPKGGNHGNNNNSGETRPLRGG